MMYGQAAVAMETITKFPDIRGLGNAVVAAVIRVERLLIE